MINDRPTTIAEFYSLFYHSFSIFHSFILLLIFFYPPFFSFTSSSQLKSTESERKFVMGWLRMEGSCAKSIMTITFLSSSFPSLPFPLPALLLSFYFLFLLFLIYLLISIVQIFLSPYSSPSPPPFTPFIFFIFC